jgi:SpoVK/Ycf46/Vps4 family AAA+-type ATPase
MIDYDYPGMMLVAPPGTGKTVYSEALAASHDVPLIKLDLSASKGSLMGESEKGIRDVFRTIHACAGQGGALFVACANSLDENIPPELRRRMGKLGIWYVDLPNEIEREAIWAIHLKKWSLDASQTRPKDSNWSGSDIANCCELAWRLECSLIEAASWQVAVLKSDPESVNRLRKAASGRWLSANTPGVYMMPTNEEVERTSRRQIEVPA